MLCYRRAVINHINLDGATKNTGKHRGVKERKLTSSVITVLWRPAGQQTGLSDSRAKQPSGRCAEFEEI